MNNLNILAEEQKEELAGIIYRGTKALISADNAETAKIDAFFAALPKAKKLRKARRDLAKDRKEQRDLDMDRYAARCILAAEKVAAQEKREAEKAERDAKRAAEKAEKAEMLAEASKEIAIGATPAVANETVIRANQAESLMDAVVAELEDLKVRRNNKLDELKQTKNKIAEMSATLKAPLKSAKVRALIAASKLLEAEISAITAERRADQKIATETGRELKALKAQTRILRVYGNAAVRPTVRMTAQQLREKRVKVQEVMRELATIEEKASKRSFQIPSFDKSYFLMAAGLDYLFKEVNRYSAIRSNGKEKEIAKRNALAAIERLKQIAEQKAPIRLKVAYSRPSRLQLNFLAMAMSINTEDNAIRTEWINVEHGIQENLKPAWSLFSQDKAEGLALARDFVKSVFELLDNVILVQRDGAETLYHGLYSSASHQKKEKLVLCREDLLELHEDIVWFGKTKAEVMKTSVTGAEIWKARANLARPIAFAIKTATGENVYLHNIMMVPDVKKTYHHKNAVMIGGDHKGKPYAFGECDNPVVVCDGGSFAYVKLNSDGWQGGGAGYKTMCVYARTSFDIAGVTLPEGKLIVCGDGCFKFDKFGYANWDEFAARMDELAKRYPGINQVYALRQSEEVEEEDRVRKVSRSLLQQIGLVASDDELHQLVDPAVKSLNRMKTFEGLFTNLAELGIPEDKRSDFAKLIFACPALLTNKNVQAIAEAKWTAKRNEIAGNKFRTKGQYPYIMQDPVAVLQIWLGGKDVNDPDLGVLKSGEASLVGVPEGVKVGALRYPANALTVKILVNRVLKDIFGECGNVAILSIHDDILIYQDGDVDGDEMGILYDELIVTLIERLHKIINPYVVVFEHGNKAARVVIEDAAAEKTAKNAEKAKLNHTKPVVVAPEDELRSRMYGALHAAKEFDSVGPYANLARDCVYLANITLKEMRKARSAKNDIEAQRLWKEFQKYILWMSAASTGAIMAIDQVKGNMVDLKLITWLEAIRSNVHHDDRMKATVDTNVYGEDVRFYAQPATQPYVKDDFTIVARDANPLVSTDVVLIYALNKAGEYTHDGQGFMKNDGMLRHILLDNRYSLTSIRTAKITSGVLTELRANYFNRATHNARNEEVDPDAKLFSMIRAGLPVGQNELLQLYWRNQCTLEFRTQVKDSAERKALYYKMVHDCLIEQALSQPWYCETEGGAYELGHEFTAEEKIASVVGHAVLSALEIGRTNSIKKENKGSFAKFVLCVFAKEILDNINRNNVDLRHFMQEGYVVIPSEESNYEATDFDLLDEYEDTQYDTYEDASVLDDGSMEFSDEPDTDYIPNEIPPEELYAY